MDIATAARLKRMTSHKDDFVKKLLANRRSEHHKRVQEYQKLVVTERARRLAERAVARCEQKRSDVIIEIDLSRLLF